MHIFILSPHRDDAAFSLAATLRLWLEAGHRVSIVNVFTRSTYAPYEPNLPTDEEQLIERVSALRRDEDEAFREALGDLAMIDLNLDDAPLRLRCPSSEVCDMLPAPEDSAIPAIRVALAQLLRRSSKETRGPKNVALVMPLALGHHVDHAIARNAAMDLAKDLPCAFYEDLPYAMRAGARDDLRRLQDQFAASLSPTLSQGTGEPSILFRRDSAALYASQVNEQEVEAIANFPLRYGGAERLWANQQWLDCEVQECLSNLQEDPEANPLQA